MAHIIIISEMGINSFFYINSRINTYREFVFIYFSFRLKKKIGLIMYVPNKIKCIDAD